MVGSRVRTPPSSWACAHRAKPKQVPARCRWHVQKRLSLAGAKPLSWRKVHRARPVRRPHHRTALKATASQPVPRTPLRPGGDCVAATGLERGRPPRRGPRTKYRQAAKAGMRCEGCTDYRCDDALDRLLELDNRCERCRRGRCDTSAEESDESEQIRHHRPISKSARRNFEQRRLEESEDEDEGECFSRLRCGDCCEAPIILTTGNDDLKDGEVLSPYRSVYRPFRGAELAKEFGRGYDSEPCAVHSDCGGLSGRTASSCSCELCKQHGLAQADVCDQCGGCKASCCLVLVTPCVDCSRCPGALDGISMVCREGCGRCTDCCSLCEGCSGCFGSSNLCPQCDRCED